MTVVFGPGGAEDCSHGWSGAAAQPPDAEPVADSYAVFSLAPDGAKEA